MNDGQYLEFCNDLKEQYEKVQKKHRSELILKDKVIAEKDDLIRHLKCLLQSQPHKSGQFDSVRPSANLARYSSVMGMMTDFDVTFE